MRPRRVIISGGGTGGHLYPALVLGRRLKEKAPDLELTFVGGGRPAEREILAREDVRYVAMRIEGLKGRGLRSLRGAALLPGALLRSAGLLLRLRPRLVVGAGGYSSGPIVLLAAWAAVPTLLLEQNVRPGFTNRILIRWAGKAAVAFAASLPYFRGKGVPLGNPVRPEFAALGPRTPDGKLSVLVFGGSQGSRVLNRALVAALPHLPGRERLRVVHQTGLTMRDEVDAAYRAAGREAEVVAFLDDMEKRFGEADLVLARSGATTCAELTVAGKAAILVPFALAADDHQRRNARALEAAGAARVLEEKDLSGESLARAVGALVAEPGRIVAMEEAARRIGRPDAAARVAELLLPAEVARA